MTPTAIISIILGLVKAFPVLARWVDEIVAGVANQRQASNDAQTAKDLADVQASPWRCPATCPHKLQHVDKP